MAQRQMTTVLPYCWDR